MKHRAIVLHTVGSAGDTTASAIRAYHVAPKPKGNGWLDIGYHFVIRKSGAIELGRPLSKGGAHLQGANDTIGVCVVGDGDREEWTPGQHQSVVALCSALCFVQGWGSDRVVGHREGPAALQAAPTSKSCPGRLVDMKKVRADIASRLK